MALMRSLLVVVLLGALASGCAFRAGAETGVSAGLLADKVSDALTETVGRAPDEVECPDPLPARVGAEVRRTLRDGSTSYGVTGTATAVEGDDVKFDIEVDQDPLP